MAMTTRSRALRARQEQETSRISIGRANAASSPLLSLPMEIQREIFTYVVGGGMIHVDTNPWAGSTTTTNRPLPLSRGICQSEASEHSAHREAAMGCSAVPSGQSSIYYVKPCGDRHAACSNVSGGVVVADDSGEPTKVHLALLSVCHPTYAEASVLFWSTNTFAFTAPEAFKSFLARLTPNQKHRITSLHIDFDLRHDWDAVTRPRLLNQLPAVKSLDLCVEILALACDLTAYDHPLWAPLLRFHRLPHVLESVRVVLADSEELFNPYPQPKEVYEMYAMEDSPIFGGMQWPPLERTLRFSWCEKRRIAGFLEARLIGEGNMERIFVEEGRRRREVPGRVRAEVWFRHWMRGSD
ncbi:MAG: hypothetical protein Q9194_006938 [Teloschistes cf. exilis]